MKAILEMFCVPYKWSRSGARAPDTSGIGLPDGRQSDAKLRLIKENTGNIFHIGFNSSSARVETTVAKIRNRELILANREVPDDIRELNEAIRVLVQKVPRLGLHP
ncbi:MAG: hypothetical protein Q7S58_01560 [Candidatus Binatus sp.]|uniref:hypothetical protein n=1 Tax=Candidatus Binatus sp. TaxID=2811406 RepID=UPI002718EA1D|nr:hypothetical protein [Candidatus Binatus sp.]MDO8431077.1 hypothetical protein [Candidatus Binatus sp.]